LPDNKESKDLYGRLGEVERDVSSIMAMVRAMSDEVKGLKAQQNQPTNWIGLGSLLLAVLLYMNTTQDPIKASIGSISSNASSVEERVNALENKASRNLGALGERTSWMGRIQRFLDTMATRNVEQEGRIGAMDARIHNLYDQDKLFESQMDIERARNADIEERLSRLEGLVERLTHQVDQVDSGGSRRWNNVFDSKGRIQE
jgi:glycerol kinase